MALIKVKNPPVALTIAGSDSGAGAGVQADLKTFAALDVHAVCAITAITAQNPAKVSRVQEIQVPVLRAQLDSLFQYFQIKAIKLGMLWSRQIIEVVEDFLIQARVPVILDPVLISTSGRALLREDALKALKQRLFPRAALITPNIPEAEHLLKFAITAPETMRQAVRMFYQNYGSAVLLKGGHLKNCNQAIDLFYDGHTELLLEAPLLKSKRLHGTGCTYASAIAAYCARGLPLRQAVQRAKVYVTQAIANSFKIKRGDLLNHFWKRK